MLEPRADRLEPDSSLLRTMVLDKEEGKSTRDCEYINVELLLHLFVTIERNTRIYRNAVNVCFPAECYFHALAGYMCHSKRTRSVVGAR